MANNYNPDVLNCIANLSNDEVFTPPTLANQVLDMLPQELFQSPKTTFLDPFTKSGVFLREIVKRLDRGLESQMPDRQARIDHIMHNQVFGIACTELTAHLSRRSLYCSKHPDGKYSVSYFDRPQGNILYTPLRHTWKNGKCKFCNASQNVYDRGDAAEQYAYQFIHTNQPEQIFKMKFDVIIGNPPYQLSDGGNAASATPIYHLFVQQAIKLAPTYLSMIIPARWLSGGRGLDSFRAEMLNDDRISVLHDFIDSEECFSGVDIKGGVCYFLWDANHHGMSKIYTHNAGKIAFTERNLLEDGHSTFIRHAEQISIIEKVQKLHEKSISEWMEAGRYYGFHTRIKWTSGNNGFLQTADGQSEIAVTKEKTSKNTTKVYIHGGVCWIEPTRIPKNINSVGLYKVIIPEAGNPDSTILAKPKVSEPGSCSSNTYISIQPKDYPFTEEISNNIISYLKTRFVRVLVASKTTTQHMAPQAYSFVPVQDFSHPWTDDMLFDKYSLTKEEIEFITALIPEMQ